MFVNKCSVELLEYFGDDLAIANMARVSRHVYNREPNERDKLLIENLAKNKHATPFEACVFKFRIACPIYIARQVFRHRSFSYNELSRMYTHKNVEFFVPETIFYNEKSFDSRNKRAIDGQLYKHYIAKLTDISKLANQMYEDFIEDRIGNEYARAVLPMNLMTDFVMIGNLRNWHHFIKLREDNFNNVEIIDIADKLKYLISDKCPVAMDMLSKYPL